MKAKVGDKTYETDVTVANSEHWLVPISSGQCFAAFALGLANGGKRSVTSRQTAAAPLKIGADLPLGLDPMSRRFAALSHVAQFPCQASAIEEAELIDLDRGGVAWEDVVAGAGVSDASNDDAPANPEKDRALNAYLDLVDAAVGAKRVATVGGRMSAAMWHDPKRGVVVLGTAGASVEPPKGDAATNRRPSARSSSDVSPAAPAKPSSRCSVSTTST